MHHFTDVFWQKMRINYKTNVLNVAICKLSKSACYSSQILQLPFSRRNGRPLAECLRNVVVSPVSLTQAVISLMHD